MNLKQAIERDIVLAKMMADDIDKVFKKYAKAALKAAEERQEKFRDEKYHGCTTIAELQEIYGYGEMSLEEYEEGIDFINAREERKNQLSLVEQHRINLKYLRDNYKGTVKELQDELNKLEGVVKDNRSYVEKLEAEERAERYKNII